MSKYAMKNTKMWMALCVAGLSFASAPAFARTNVPEETQQSCTTDEDCDATQDEVCTVVEESCMASSEPGSEPTCTSQSVCMKPSMPDFNECQADSDCPGSFTCQQVGEVCTGTATPATPDGTGEMPDSTVTCQAYSMCVPPPPPSCDPTKASADCDSGFECTTFTFQSCSGEDTPPPSTDGGSTGTGTGSVEPGGGESPTQPACETKTESYCVPPYVGECAADADCGPGFTCVAEEICPPCARPEPAPGDGDAPNDEPVTCSAECAPSGEKYCQLKELPCSTDSECPSSFKCETFDSPVAVEPTEPSCDPDGSDCDTMTGDMGSSTPGGEPMQPPPSQGYCVPPAWDTWISPGGDTQNGTPTNESAPNYDDRITGSTGKDSGWKITESKPASQTPGTAQPSADGGCSSTGSTGDAGLGGLALLGMMLGFRRRRQR